MPNFSQLFGGGGSDGGVYEQRVFVKSGTFIAPVNGLYLLSLIGGGGGGMRGGRGGAAAGFSQKLVQLAAGTAVNYTVGAGGQINGGTGGTSTLTTTGVSMAATGGSPDTPGTASGGDINVTGGSSGNSRASGGGAVGVYGVTPAASLEGLNNGGAGVGSPGVLYGVPGTALGFVVSNTAEFSAGRLLLPIGRGGLSQEGSPRNGLPGGGGYWGYSSNGGNGGMFAGGGGTDATTSGGGEGGMFGGGGGGTTGQGSSMGGSGGQGGLIIEFMRGK